jgi:hypothetical protein
MMAVALVAASILVLEIGVFNFPFWSTLSASTDSTSAANTLGPGLSRLDSGLLEVTDPTTAWMDVSADGSSSYARIDPVSSTSATRRSVSERRMRPVPSTVHVRLDSDGHAGRTRSIDVDVPRSLYLRTTATATIRLWVQEPKGTLLPLSALRANVHVPFQISVTRVLAMAVLGLLIIAWRPGSSWWTVDLDLRHRRQRAVLVGSWVALGVGCAAYVIPQLISPGSLSFHAPRNYTYDFNQYGHVAEALSQGHAWLDLPVPQKLASSINPYDPIERERLLREGVTPIYWDYAFHDGRWYSYFGVLPAVVLFLPYHLVSRLWVSGGATMPPSCAVALLLTVFVILDSALVLLLIRRIRPHVSLAIASMAVTVSVLGAGAAYLAYQRDFYSVPVVFSLALSAAGLILWLTAETDGTGRWVARWGTAPGVSIPRIAAGSLLMAANLGSRPSFIMLSLLAIPIFHRQLSQIIATTIRPHARHAVRGLLTAAGVSILPSAIVVAPLLWYNQIRFGSLFDFGVDYQITVVDMTTYSTPAANILPMMGYYLALPFHTIDSFPWLATSPTPLTHWSYTEPLTMGLFVSCPLVALSLAAPLMRRRWRGTGMWPVLASCTALGLMMMTLDTIKGGLGWRYMSDFGWILSIPAVCVLAWLLPAPPPSSLPAPDKTGRSITRRILTITMRTVLLMVLFWTILAAVSSMLVIGRDNALIRSDPMLFHTVQSWFLPWL